VYTVGTVGRNDAVATVSGCTHSPQYSGREVHEDTMPVAFCSAVLEQSRSTCHSHATQAASTEVAMSGIKDTSVGNTDAIARERSYVDAVQGEPTPTRRYTVTSQRLVHAPFIIAALSRELKITLNYQVLHCKRSVRHDAAHVI